MSVDETLREYVATVRPGDEDALHHLRMLILTMRWIGLEGEVMSAERVVRLLAAGTQPPATIAHLPGPRLAHGHAAAGHAGPAERRPRPTTARDSFSPAP